MSYSKKIIYLINYNLLNNYGNEKECVLMPKVNPYVVLVIGVISVSTSAILVKLSDAPSGVIAFYRLFFSVLIMLPVFLVKYIGELRLITKKDWMFSIV